MVVGAVRAFIARLHTPPPRARIVLRQSPDWRNTPHAELLEGSRAFCRLVGPATGFAENFISDIVAVWDRTFRLPYFQVRAAMKDIAADNLRAVRHATLTPLERIGHVPGAHALHLYIDDDDWLHPQLCRELAQHLDGADGYVFGNILCASRVELRRIEDGCYTNNYAVAEHFLRAPGADPTRVVQHWDANAVFHQPGFRRCDVPLYLSATNKHPASAMKLKDGLQRDALSAATLRGLVERYLDESAAAPLPPAAAWVRPYTRRVRDVFARLL